MSARRRGELIPIRVKIIVVCPGCFRSRVSYKAKSKKLTSKPTAYPV